MEPWEKYATPAPWEKYKQSAADREAADRELYSPTRGQSFAENAIQGVGRGMASIGRALNPFTTAEETADAAQTDAALLKTGGGKVGNVVGQAAVVAPTMLIPGANTVAGAGLIGGVTGAATTEGGWEDRLKGGAFGAGGGALGVAAGKGLGWAADKAVQARAATQSARQAANAGKDAAAVEAQKAGYVLPPTEVNPSMFNSALEGFSGKIKTSQSASAKNQAVTDDLAKKALGLPADKPITVADLKTIRSTAGQAYDAVANVGAVKMPATYDAALDTIVSPYIKASQGFPGAKVNPIVAEIESLRTPVADAGSIVAKIKELRATADAAYIKGDKDLGKALKSGADALEDAIDSHLVATGAPGDLLKNFREARTLIAKTYSVERALNPTTGNVSAAKLAASKKPLTNELQTIAETGRAFPKATQTLQQNYNALSPLDYMGALLSSGATGNPLMAASLVARPGVRAGVLSKPYQAMLRPDYGPSTTLNALQALTNNDQLRRLTPGLAGLLPGEQ
jgi:hypothetical protein